MDEPCKRIRCTINNENYYFIVGKTWLMVKIPYENRVENAAVRDAMTQLGDDITKALEELNND